VANLVFVAGRKGCGKSTLLRTLVNYNLEAHPNTRYVVWDSTNEWTARDRVEVHKAHEISGEEAAARAIELAPATLVMDEIDRVAPAPHGLEPGSALHSIVHYGRHHGNGRGVALLCAARRSGRVHLDVRALADVIYYFRHREPRDLHWIQEISGERWADAVQRLPPHQFLRCDL
jgi:energy-coupling factor transporter ATP-binding protein EcfA2